MERRQSRCRRRAEVARTFVAFAKMGAPEISCALAYVRGMQRILAEGCNRMCHAS